jgi:hypothetical protein
MSAEGYTVDRILDSHPELTVEDVKALVGYPARVVAESSSVHTQ